MIFRHLRRRQSRRSTDRPNSWEDRSFQESIAKSSAALPRYRFTRAMAIDNNAHCAWLGELLTLPRRIVDFMTLWLPRNRSTNNSQPIDKPFLPAIRSLERRARYLFYCMFFCLFGQRFLDKPRADSSQVLHAGVFWFRMCLLSFWGLAAPGGRKRWKWNFRYYGSQWGIFAFW